MQNKYDIKLMRLNLQNYLDNRRYEHTLGVEKTAVFLAKRHHLDVEKARVAALLHDCAKNISNHKKLKLCKKYNLELTNKEMRNPDLIHAKVGAIIAKHIYNIKNCDIINAITYHTTGRPNMSELEKVIYIADYIEPGRTNAPHLTRIRELAKRELDEALLSILKDTIIYLESKEKVIDPLTMEAYKYYKAIKKN